MQGNDEEDRFTLIHKLKQNADTVSIHERDKEKEDEFERKHKLTRTKQNLTFVKG